MQSIEESAGTAASPQLPAVSGDPCALRQFVPGPVPIEAHLLAIGQQQLPYSRTEAFSAITREILEGLKTLFQTEGEVALLTGSGTAAMEASILNFLNETDRAVIINGGTFGQRWCDICDALAVPYDEVRVPAGGVLDLEHVGELLSSGSHSTLVATAHETSTGHLFNIEALGELAKHREALFIVDAISSICADPFEMDAWHVDVAVLSSHKALALPPGMSFVAMNERAIARLGLRAPKSLYFDLKIYLQNQQRGQLPFTPAIGLMLQLQRRLSDIRGETISALNQRHQQRADTFRMALVDTMFEILPARCSSAMTALTCGRRDATEIVNELWSQHGLLVAPNGGELKSSVIRVAHMGAQVSTDVDLLIAALRDIDSKSPH